MKIIRIPKRGTNKFRTVYVPTEDEKKAALSWLPLILSATKDKHGVLHGFVKGRSPVTNAMAHVGWRYTISFDLAEFFDTVTQRHLPVPLTLNPGITKDCLFDGAARQGIPTSPAIANLAILPVVEDIAALNRSGRFGKLFVFTVYADDISLSFDMPHVEHLMRSEIPRIVEKHGFKINESKTHLQCSVAGYRIITGVAVGDKEVVAPRYAKRRLRAMKHQLKHGLRKRGLRRLMTRIHEIRRTGGASSLHGLLLGQHRGLTEWLKLRLPKDYKEPSKNPIVVAARVVVLQLANAVNYLSKPFSRKLIIDP